MVCQCGHLDVAVMFVFLSPILSLLLPCQIWQESGSQRGFHQVTTETIFTSILRNGLTDLVSSFNFRKYQPVLKNFPLQYIHEPWNAPESVQRAAKCVIGKDYPLPMVNHLEVSQLNIERMKQVYQRLTQYRGAGESLRSITRLFSISDD